MVFTSGFHHSHLNGINNLTFLTHVMPIFLGNIKTYLHFTSFPDTYISLLLMDRRQHDDVIKRKHFPHYWSLVRGIHWSPVDSPHKGQWSGAVMFSLICTWTHGWANNREAGDLRRHCDHYDATVTRGVRSLVAADTMAADDLAPSVARPSATMVLIMRDKWIRVFHKEGFQLPLQSECCELRENTTLFLYFLNKIKK